jgi:hypothetical protein
MELRMKGFDDMFAFGWVCDCLEFKKLETIAKKENR